MKTKHFLTATIFLLSVSCEKLDTMERAYPDAKAAIKDGAVERGVIPVFLPPSAKDIREKHNLDTNEVWLQFSMEPGERGSIEKSCQRIQTADSSPPRIGGGNGWPQVLTKSKWGDHQDVERYAHYRCEDGGFVAVERDHRVFYWRRG